MKLFALTIAFAVFCLTCNAQVISPPPAFLTLPESGFYNFLNSSDLLLNSQFNSTLIQENMTIWEFMLNNSMFSNLTNLIKQNNLVEFIDILNTTSQSVLFFAPSNVALSNFEVMNSTGLFPSLNSTLFFHLVESVSGISNNIQTLPFFNASRVEVSFSPEKRKFPLLQCSSILNF